MRLAAFLASAIAILGLVSSAPVKDTAALAADERALAAPNSLEARAYSPLLASAISNIHAANGDRGRWVQDIVGGLRDRFRGHNVLMYHRFQGNFRWSVSDPGAMEAEARFVEGLRTEYFQVVVFRSPGTLERTGGDGGYRNWGFAGWFSRDGDRKVNFRTPGT